MTADRELATDIYVHDAPEDGGTVHFPAGTRESDLPQWVSLTDDLFADPDAKDTSPPLLPAEDRISVVGFTTDLHGERHPWAYEDLFQPGVSA